MAGDGEGMEDVAGLSGLTVFSGKAKEDNGRTGAVVRFSSQFLVLDGESEPPKNKAENIFPKPNFTIFHNSDSCSNFCTL